MVADVVAGESTKENGMDIEEAVPPTVPDAIALILLPAVVPAPIDVTPLTKFKKQDDPAPPVLPNVTKPDTKIVLDALEGVIVTLNPASAKVPAVTDTVFAVMFEVETT